MKRPVELPTLAVAALIHTSWVVLTLAAARMPWWSVAPLGAFLVAWHGSLQHETIHGHPTRSRRINTLIGSLPLGLWIPYGVYRDLHMRHHRTMELTDPLDDPESYYVSKDAWTKMDGLRRALLRANSTLAGRLLLGPIFAVVGFFWSELRRVARGDLTHARAWAAHLVGVAAVVLWLELVCHLSLARYVLLFAYPGLALTLLRSFAEHRPAPLGNAHRIGIVEAGPLASLLYLNNNLHVVHHEDPALPWYELPARYNATREDILARNGGFSFPSYAALFVRFGLRSKDLPVHPTR